MRWRRLNQRLIFNISQKIPRCWRVCRVYLLSIIGIWIVASCLGFSDFFYEEDFMNFTWADINVREQVQKEVYEGAKTLPQIVNDMENLRTFSAPIRCENSNKTILIVIKTAPERTERRNAYRATLSRLKSRNNWNIRTVFVMGHYNYDLDDLLTESKEQKDMIIGDFNDHYYNNSYKLLHTMKMAMSYCSEIPFILSMDDDYIINIDNVIQFFSRRNKDERLYAGWRMYAEPFRWRFNKFGLTLAEYPYNLFPPFISGGMVFLSPLTVREFYSAMKYCKLHKFDDVYLGIVAYILEYHPQSVPEANVRRDLKVEKPVLEGKMGEHGYTPNEIEQYIPYLNMNITDSKVY